MQCAQATGNKLGLLFGLTMEIFGGEKILSISIFAAVASIQNMEVCFEEEMHLKPKFSMVCALGHKKNPVLQADGPAK